MPRATSHPDPLPCKGGHWIVPKKRLLEWEATYPSLDVSHEIEKMRQWLTSNGNRLKTHRGMRAFITGWLNRRDETERRERSREIAPPLETGDEPGSETCDKRFALLVELKRDKTLTHAERMRILDERYPVK